MFKNTILFCLLIFGFEASFGQQDSIAGNVEIDTTKIDTVVIRRNQDKIKYTPRGAKLINSGVSQTKTKTLSKNYNRFNVPSFWTKTNRLGINLSEVAFVNWNAGGINSFSALGTLRFERNYKFRYIQWDNFLEMRYGLNAQERSKLRKTEDAIRLSSTFGLRRDTTSNWYYSARANFNTQFSNGFRYPERVTPISRFMSPGYSFLGAGTSYITEDQKFNLYMSPLTQKSTFVLDQDLANKGAFGVKRAVFDVNGDVLIPGENVFLELGILLTNQLQTEIGKNVVLNNRLSLYTDYLRRFGNIDIDWEMTVKMKVNEYIMTTLGTHIIYDDDIRFDQQTDAVGNIIDRGEPRIQFKQLLSIGIAYDF